MKTKIYFLLLIAWSIWSCYEDKGNYDYREVNEVAFTFSPASNSGDNTNTYVYRQPSLDTLSVTYRPVISQTLKENAANLAYRWIVVGEKDYRDTVESLELTLKFFPKVKTEYMVLFRLTDLDDNVSYHTMLTMKTQLPFMRSYLVLHGKPGDRQIGAIENPDSANSLITYDVYQELFGERKFENAEHLLYCGRNGVSVAKLDSYEQLIVTGPDSVDYMYAYDFVIRKRYEDIIPNLDMPRITGGFAVNTSHYCMLMDEQHKLYHSGGEGSFFSLKASPVLENYKADKIYTSDNDYTTIWDEANRKLMYYFNGGNYYSAGAANSNRSLLTYAPFRTTYTATDGSVKNREVIWLGKRLNTGEGREGATLLVKDTVYTFHQINYNVQNEQVKIDSIVIKRMDIDGNSCFATSLAFANQLFYSTGHSLYVLNLASGEVRQLYNAGGMISQIQFRAVNRLDSSLDKNENFKLAVVVNKGDKGEVHDLYFSQAADLIDVKVHSGFGPIQDIVYTIVMWNMFDEVKI